MSEAISALIQQGYRIQASSQAFGLPRANYYRLRQEPQAKTDDPLRPQVQQVALGSKWLWTGPAMAIAASRTS